MRTGTRWVAALLIAASALGRSNTAAQQPSLAQYFVYVGTYTRQTSKGIYAFRFEPSSGRLTPMGLAAESPSPSFLAVHPSGRYLYAVNEQSEGASPGDLNTVSAFAINPVTGQLNFLNKVSAEGDGPCHLSIDKTGSTLLVANYGNGTISTIPVRKDGRLDAALMTLQHRGSSVHPVRQLGPHAHFIAPSPDNRFALAVDLGMDRVMTYPFDAKTGRISAATSYAEMPAGSGPRHLAFHPDGRYVYVNNELSSTVSAFAYQARTGALKMLQTVSTLPPEFSGTSTTAEIQINPAGRFLYVSNRGLDSIAVFAIDARSGLLSAVEQAPTQGKTPRHFSFDPSGAFVFAGNQDSNSLIVYRVDPVTGRLTPAQPLIDTPEPVCIVFVPVQSPP